MMEESLNQLSENSLQLDDAVTGNFAQWQCPTPQEQCNGWFGQDA